MESEALNNLAQKSRKEGEMYIEKENWKEAMKAYEFTSRCLLRIILLK